MPKADSVHTTPPTNTPIDTARRGFLGGTVAALAAGTAVKVAALATIRPVAATIAAPASALDASRASPELGVMRFGRWLTPMTFCRSPRRGFIEADRKAWAWQKEHPEPTGKQAPKRWARKFCDCRDDTCMAEWHAQLEAEDDFMEEAICGRGVRANELGLMAAAAAVYDETQLG